MFVVGFCVALVEVENLLDSGIVKAHEFADYVFVSLIWDEMIDRWMECGQATLSLLGSCREGVDECRCPSSESREASG